MGERMVDIKAGATSGTVTVQRDEAMGADCSGTNGDVSRVLVLSNTLTSIISVVVSGSPKHHTIDYTLSGSSVVFIFSLDDDQPIEVVYI